MTIDANELPRGWVTSNLEGITTAVSTNGKKVKTKDAQTAGEFPVIDQGAAECAGYLDDESLVIHASVDQPIVLFGDHTRIVKYIERDFIPGADGTKLIQAKSGIQPKYLHYLVAAAEVPDRGYGRHFHHLKEIELPVAPAAEQKRIADKLDTVLTRVDAVNTRLARVAPLLKRFRQSVLAAATSGRLTVDWRSNSAMTAHKEIKLGDESWKIPDAWDVIALSQTIEPTRPLCYGVVQPGDAREGGVPLIRVQDMENGAVLVNELRTVAKEIDNDFRRSRVKPGDILVSVVGTIGRTAIVPDGFEGNIARAIARVCCKRGVNPRWLNYWFNSPSVQWWLLSSSKEVARKTLNLGDLASLACPIPQDAEQTEIVRRVEALFAFADRLEARLAQAQTAATRLTPALLAKAFRGELVPQDPNDEPAAELLRLLAAPSDEATGRAKKQRKISSIRAK